MTIAAMSAVAPLSDADLAELQALLDDLPAPLEPLDVSALDGYLVGVLLQPKPLAPARWLAHVHDVDGRAPPPGVSLTRLHTLVRQRHAELAQAIAQRAWFDPWVFEVEADGDEPMPTPSQAVLPWVAGFATAMALFPALMARADEPALLTPLAVLYAALDAHDLEDAERLLAEIDTLEPPATLADAVEDLVQSTLLLADATQARAAPRRRR
jgi:uncharacterized protein